MSTENVITEKDLISLQATAAKLVEKRAELLVREQGIRKDLAKSIAAISKLTEEQLRVNAQIGEAFAALNPKA